MTAARVYAEQFPDGPGYRRALATSFWRVFSPPPQDWPLALCDFRSLRDDEGLANQLYFVDRIPDDPLAAVVDESKMITSGSEFLFSCPARGAGALGRMKIWAMMPGSPATPWCLGACEPVFSLACGSPRISGLLL